MPTKCKFDEKKDGTPSTQHDMLMAIASGHIHSIKYGAVAKGLTLRLPIATAVDVETIRLCNGENLASNVIVGELLRFALDHLDASMHEKGNEALIALWNEKRSQAWDAVTWAPKVNA